MNTYRARAVSREAPSEPGPQAQVIRLSVRGVPIGVAICLHHDLDCRGSRTSTVQHTRRALWRRVFCFLIYGLCSAAAVATFVVIVLKISQAKLSGFLSGGIQGIVLGVFSTPFVTRLFVTVVFISGLFRGARTGNELDPQPREGEIHELMMEVIEASVLYPAIILNVLKAHSESDAEQKILDAVYDVSVVVLALGWIALWFSGGRNGQTENTNRWSEGPVQSPNDNCLGARERNRPGARGDASDTFDSFTRSNDVEMATLGVT